MIMCSMNSALSLCRPHCATAGVRRQPQRHGPPKRQEKQEWDTMGHNGTEIENSCPNAVPQIGNNANFRAKWDNMGIYGNAWEKFCPFFPAQTPDPPHVRPSRIAAPDFLHTHRIPLAKCDSPAGCRRAIASYLSAHKIGLMSVDMGEGVAVPPSVPGARVDGGLDSRIRGKHDLLGLLRLTPNPPMDGARAVEGG